MNCIIFYSVKGLSLLNITYSNQQLDWVVG